MAYSRISEENFVREIRKVLAIEFREKMAEPDMVRLMPNSDRLVDDVLNGVRIEHRTYLDEIFRHVAENFVLSPEEEAELRKLIFRL